MPKKLFSLILSFAALLVALPVFAKPDAKPTNLRPQWEQGQSVRYAFWSKTLKTESATLAGQTQDEKTTYLTEGETTWKVDSTNPDGTLSCTMTLDKIKFTITSDKNKDKPTIVDSENPDPEQGVFKDLVAAMTQVPIKVTVKADGSIESVSGVDALRQAAGQAVQDADIVPEELDFMESASELATLIAAPASATPGQTWNSKNKWNQNSVIPGTDTLGEWDTTFTYDSVADIAGVPIATIKSKSEIEMKVDLSKLPEQSPDIDVQVQDATAKGEILFDLSRNETVARNDSMSYTATITVTPPTDRIPPIKINVTESSQSQLLRIAEEAEE